jgi:iron complex transport system substrate-binding protein
MQAKLNIPFVVISPDLKKIPQAYEFFGRLTGNEKRAARLSAASGRIIDRAVAISRRSKAYSSFYYGMSDNGLSTVPGDSVYMDVFNLFGMKQVYSGSKGGPTNRVRINMEELVAMNPEYIIIGGDSEKRGGGSIEWIFSDTSWNILPAVKKRNVFAAPELPYNWLDKPPSVNRLPGILWITWLFYPDEMKDADFVKEVKEYYREFYHVNIVMAVHDRSFDIRAVGFSGI